VSLGNVGITHFQAGRLELAQTCYERAQNIDTVSGNTTGLAFNLMNLGELAKTRGQFTQAKGFFEGAISKYLDASDLRNAINATLSLAQVLSAQGYTKDALRVLEDSMRLAEEMGDDSLKAEVRTLAVTINDSLEDA
jgi:tetratricopeptide (TPR) repeat protein